MRAFSLCAGAAASAAAVALAVTSCGDKVQSGLTGVDIQVTFESDLQIKRLRFAGFIGQDAAFPPDDRPHVGDERELDPTDENLIVLLPDAMGTKQVFVRVDGTDQLGAIMASAGAAQVVETDKILAIRVHLGEPRICGDGMKHATAEQCDDGNQLPGDGCSGECVIETGWECDGSPSVCRSCGDGVCSVGEDECSCPEEECRGIGTCGDGMCCPSRDENVCSCPDDCLDEDTPTCPDGYCCPEERVAGNCEPDCGMCGDHQCEPGKGEDSCTCPGDCAEQTSVCGNQNCCDQSSPPEDIGNCALDCCPNQATVDGVCCPNESAESTPEDCCATMAQCGDSVCCPGEENDGCPECCDNVCGDGDCCGTENVAACPQDCCPACGDFQGCTGCCAGECPPGSDCNMTCDSGCSCYFDCTAETCDVTCTSSSCYVQCGSQACNVTCQSGVTTGDGGVVRGTGGADPFGACYCNGPGCNLNCPPGTPVVNCNGGGIACGTGSCPP